MGYSTLDDINGQISEEDLIHLTDDAGVDAVDNAVIARAISDADAEIDSYCANRYSTPFSTVPDMIRKISVDMAIYHLFSRRALAVPDVRQKRYDNAVRFMRDVSNGRISLGTDALSPTNTDNSVGMNSNTRVFTRSKLRPF
jgi:phage gp36-like protein